MVVGREFRRMSWTILMIFLLNSCSRCQQEPEELYSETPCELHYLSAFKDVQGNLWGVGNGNVWWFNSTNLSWSLLPLPNGTSKAVSWRVACGDPKKYVALLSSAGTLILHLPWQHWQSVDSDEVNDSIESSSTWCKSGVLYASDTGKTEIYVLDLEDAKWTLHSDVQLPSVSNDSLIKYDIGNSNRSFTWLLPSGAYILLDNQNSCHHLLSSNTSGMEWFMLKKRDNLDKWPVPEGHSVTWVQESDGPCLWLWWSGNTTNLWAFNVTDLSWKDYTETAGTIPELEGSLTSWVDEDRLCYLKRTETCTALYSASTTTCWTVHDLPITTSHAPSTPTDLTTETSVQTDAILAQMRTPRPMIITAHSVINKHSLLSALQSEVDAPDTSDEMPMAEVVSTKHKPWHQHTSVFGSIIFFGTSLTVFGMVFTIWCVRRCVHFPKEALLLRDPPSVRYTAIPDNVPYDARGHASTAYTVIPDSIA